MSKLTKDARYSVQLEWCGYAQPKFVARFCGDWLGWRDTREEARQLCKEHIRERGFAWNQEVKS